MEKRYTGTWESVREHQVPQWYNDCKFGIFIHWGVYSVPAYAPRTWELGEVPGDETWFCNNPYAEWYYNSVNVGTGPTYEHHKKVYGEDFPYENFTDMWEAENWDPKAWAELFKEAGAGYVVLVTKHHDGFCLFPSEYTDYHTANRGPMRDIVGELTKEVREQELKMGMYYSGIIDWRFAHDPIFREEENFENACPTFEYADYAYKQCMELIDRYHPSVLWNDIGWPKQGTCALPSLLSHYYNTVKEGVVNDRFNGLYHDYLTKEYKYGKTDRTQKWEMCRGMGLSFGYNEEEGDDKIISIGQLIRLLVETVSNNGNLLINIGPKADGTIPAEQENRLKEIGCWLKRNGDGIYGTCCSTRENMTMHNGSDRADHDIFFTEKNDRLYIFTEVPVGGAREIMIPGLTKESQPEGLDPSVQYEASFRNGGLLLDVKKNGSEYDMIGFSVKKE